MLWLGHPLSPTWPKTVVPSDSKTITGEQCVVNKNWWFLKHQNTSEPTSSGGCAMDSAGRGAYSAPPDPLAGGESLLARCPSPRTPSPLSALWSSGSWFSSLAWQSPPPC